MNHLILNYLINGGFTILKMILFGVGFDTQATQPKGYWISLMIVDKIWKIDVYEQLREKRVGAWIWASALLLALAYCEDGFTS